MMIAAFALPLVLAALLWVALRSGRHLSDDGRALELFRTQLLDLDTDLAAGRLASDQARALRLEIQKRMVRESRRAEDATRLTERPTRPFWAVLLIAIPFGLTSALYLARGKPETPSAARQLRPEPSGTMVQAYNAAHAALLRDPADINAWLQMTTALGESGKTAEASEALAVATGAMPQSPELWIARGEALMRHSGGVITPASRLAFDRASQLAPDHPAPRFYLALAWMQAAKPREALETLEALAAQSPADAPWMPRVSRMMRGARAMMAAGVDGTAER